MEEIRCCKSISWSREFGQVPGRWQPSTEKWGNRGLRTPRRAVNTMCMADLAIPLYRWQLGRSMCVGRDVVSGSARG